MYMNKRIDILENKNRLNLLEPLKSAQHPRSNQYIVYFYNVLHSSILMAIKLFRNTLSRPSF